jgi:hypothetical protein
MTDKTKPVSIRLTRGEIGRGSTTVNESGLRGTQPQYASD